METTSEVSFSSFIAGVLLVYNKITNLELSILMSKFEYEYQIDFSQDYLDYNYNILCNLFVNDENGFKLCVKHNDIVTIDNLNCTVYDYLYGFTTSDIRKFFNIPEKNINRVKK